jgi:hypothetical protein
MEEIALHGFLLDESATFAKRENRSVRSVFLATAKPRRENGSIFLSSLASEETLRGVLMYYSAFKIRSIRLTRLNGVIRYRPSV